LHRLIGKEVNLKYRALGDNVKELRDDGKVEITKRKKQGNVSFFTVTVSPKEYIPDEDEMKVIKEIGGIAMEFIDSLEGLMYDEALASIDSLERLTYDEALASYLIHLNKIVNTRRSTVSRTTGHTPLLPLELKKSAIKLIEEGKLKPEKIKAKHKVQKRTALADRGTYIKRGADGNPILFTKGKPNPEIDDKFFLYFYDRPVRKMTAALLRHLHQEVSALSSLDESWERRQQQAN
jgi:hypothetical protein